MLWPFRKLDQYGVHAYSLIALGTVATIIVVMQSALLFMIHRLRVLSP